MPLQKHLVVHLQEMFSTERDYREFLQEKSGRLRDRQLQSMVSEEVQEIGRQLDNLKQALANFNEFPTEMKSPIVQALRREDQDTHQAMPNMTPADMDVHVCLTDVSFGQMEIGMYQGMVDMAQALNQREVTDLLQQNLQHEQQDVRKMQQMLPDLIRSSQHAA